jgi:acyl carrier protein
MLVILGMMKSTTFWGKEQNMDVSMPSHEDLDAIILGEIHQYIPKNDVPIEKDISLYEYGIDSIDAMDMLYQIQDKLDMDKRIEFDSDEKLTVNNIKTLIQKNLG